LNLRLGRYGWGDRGQNISGFLTIGHTPAQSAASCTPAQKTTACIMSLLFGLKNFSDSVKGADQWLRQLSGDQPVVEYLFCCTSMQCVSNCRRTIDTEACMSLTPCDHVGCFTVFRSDAAGASVTPLHTGQSMANHPSCQAAGYCHKDMTVSLH